jgi:hypothetical protein
LAEFSYNDKVNSSTHQTPFYLNWGQHPRKGVEPRRESKVEAADAFVERMEGLRKEATAALERASRDMKKFYNRKHLPSPTFKPGDLVLLEGENLKTNRPSKKLEHQRFGPFPIKKKVGETRLSVEATCMLEGSSCVPCVKLTPYAAGSTLIHDHPPPDLIDDQLEQEIEDILDEQVCQGRKQYLVKWKGFPMEESEWKTEIELTHAKEILDDFKSQHTCAPRPKRGGNVRKSP